MAVVPVLAVTRQGGQSFVLLPSSRTATCCPPSRGHAGRYGGNSYSVSSGLNAGDRVIVSSTQFLINNMPVMPLPGA